MARKRKKRSSAKKTTSDANTSTEQRSTKKEIATVAIQSVKNMVNILKPYELSEANRLATFQAMMLDDAIYNCYDSTAILVEKAFTKYYVEYNNNSEKSKEAKKFLEWNLNNLGGRQSVGTIARSGIEFKRDGLAPFEKTFERSYGEWETTPSGVQAWKLNKLNYIHPMTLMVNEPFVVTNGGRTVVEMRQSTTALKNSPSSKHYNFSKDHPKGYISVPMPKVVLMTYSATDAQPFGQSPFEACYTAWREKVLFQDLTSVGVSKDLAGTPVLTIPAAILNTAATDPDSPEADMVLQLQEQMANLHAGDQANMIMPSDTFGDSGNGTVAEYGIKFLGIQGSKFKSASLFCKQRSKKLI